MSSHHIVRENQEPALFIQDPDALRFEKIQELLEWSPTVLVPFRAVPTVMDWGIKVDAVLVQPHEAAPARELLHTQQPLTIISVNTSREEFSTVVFFLKDQAHKGVYVVSHDAALFHFEPWPPDFDVELFQGGIRWMHVRKSTFEKWYPGGTSVFVRTTTETTEQVTAADGILKVSMPEGFWVGERV